MKEDAKSFKKLKIKERTDTILDFFRSIFKAEYAEEKFLKRKNLFSFNLKAKKNRSLMRAVKEIVREISLFKEKIKDDTVAVKKIMRRNIEILPQTFPL